MALLLWAYLTSIALFLGIAFCAQLEAVPTPASGDPGGRRPRAARPASASTDRPRTRLGTVRQTLPLRMRPSQAAASR